MSRASGVDVDPVRLVELDVCGPSVRGAVSLPEVVFLVCAYHLVLTRGFRLALVS